MFNSASLSRCTVTGRDHVRQWKISVIVAIAVALGCSIFTGDAVFFLLFGWQPVILLLGLPLIVAQLLVRALLPAVRPQWVHVAATGLLGVMAQATILSGSLPRRWYVLMAVAAVTGRVAVRSRVPAARPLAEAGVR